MTNTTYIIPLTCGYDDKGYYCSYYKIENTIIKVFDSKVFESNEEEVEKAKKKSYSHEV